MKIQEQKRGKLSEQDRLALGALLLKAGYMVRVGADKPDKGTRIVWYIEAFTGSQTGAQGGQMADDAHKVRDGKDG